MLRSTITICIVLFLFGCDGSNSKSNEDAVDKKSKVTLLKKWESDTVFTTAESVIYDEKRDLIFVSNIEEGPWEADGKGSIGQLSLDGEVINPRWIEGLNAPKGLGIVGDKLYVTDLQTVVEIDIPNGEISNNYIVEGSDKINDISTSPDGKVYISDSGAGKIFVLENGEVKQIKEGLARSNGIYFEDDRLIIGTWGDEKVNAFSFESQELTTVSDSITQPDGIEADGEGGYFVSSWKGLVHYIHPDGSSEIILDTTADEIGAADFDYVKSKNLLIVPTFFHNTVVAYEVKKE